MVRLLPKTKPKMLPAIAKFQSHNGAIAAVFLDELFDPDASFNPTMVRLLPVMNEWFPQPSPRFNPTMVRLLLRSPSESVPCRLFQSHNGAIAAVKALNLFRKALRFQSHNGAIAALTNIRPATQHLMCFNPTMVRLLPRQNFGI